MNAELEFGNETWHWRRPAPYNLVTVPEGERLALQNLSTAVNYG
jgi:hypothetical protein